MSNEFYKTGFDGLANAFCVLAETFINGSQGAKPVEIVGALYEGIHSVGYIELVIKNYLNKMK